MPYRFTKKNRLRNNKTRRLSLFPRLGIYVDFLGKEFSFKQVPLIETFYNVLNTGLTLSNLKRIKNLQFSEIVFSKDEKKQTIDTTAKSVKRKEIK